MAFQLSTLSGSKGDSKDEAVKGEGVLALTLVDLSRELSNIAREAEAESSSNGNAA